MESGGAAHSLLLDFFEIEASVLGGSTDVGVLDAENDLGVDCLFIANRDECVAEPEGV